MGRSQELSEFQRGTVIGCHLCNKPRKLTERGHRMLRREEIANFLQSHSLQTCKLHVAFRLAQEQCTESFMEWVSMAEQLHPSHTSP
ncbi:hypothetical protein M9458_041184, partial [Cirrhinus mrigala]